jgi:hypothetical protein
MTARVRHGLGAQPDSLRRSTPTPTSWRAAKEGARGGTMGSPTLIYEGGEEWIGRGS